MFVLDHKLLRPVTRARLVLCSGFKPESEATSAQSGKQTELKGPLINPTLTLNNLAF